MHRREPRRQHQALVVAVRHDEAADEPRGRAPAGRPRMIELALLVLKLDVERLREILPEEMARARLQRLAVLHHRLDTQRMNRPGKLLPVTFGPHYNGH